MKRHSERNRVVVGLFPHLQTAPQVAPPVLDLTKRPHSGLFSGPHLLKPLAVLLALNYLGLYRYLVVSQALTTLLFRLSHKLLGILIHVQS
jgi:hypothetical protein